MNTVVPSLVSLGVATLASGAVLHRATAAMPERTVQVSGSGTDLVSGAIVHSKQETPGGQILQSTETVELSGDLHGRVLYQVTSVFDFAKHRLVNTGNQVYSGTVAGSAPVMLHDDRFRFEADLASGADRGWVFLTRRIAGPAVSCTLEVVGSGKDPAGNPTFNYSGTCTFAAAP